MRILLLNQAPRTAARGPAYEVEPIEKLVNSYASPGTRIEIGFPENFEGSEVFHTLGAQSGLNGLHHMIETPSIVRKIIWAAENGYDAVISSNTFDPGVDGGRLAVDIPVIGPLRTAMHAALTLADRVGITVPLASHLPYTRRILRSYGLESFVTGIKPIGVYGEDIKSRKAEIFDITTKLIRTLIDEGAEIIVPLGGALIPYVVDPADLTAATGVQVLNTKAICVRFAEMCVNFKMTQSALTYPRGKLTSADFTRS
ncbi:MAG TPA: aspartate/glutamate racemase family protein [Micropepsaceae bacterium]|nr:aspartate/glutamate racemase family protein [Micropepsaceae bacterium]